MTKNTKTIIWISVGAAIVVTGFIVYNSNNFVKPDSNKKDVKSKDLSLGKSSQTETELLKERIYLTENRSNFRNPKVEGYNEFIDRTKKALDETEEKELDFYNTDEGYFLVKDRYNVVAELKKVA